MSEPISVVCACGKTLRAKPELAGKRVKCPACQQTVQIPALPPAAQPAYDPYVDEEDDGRELQLSPLDGANSATQPPAQPAMPQAADAPVWYVRNATGQQFGPMTKAQLDQSVANGSIKADFQVWQQNQAPMAAGQMFPQLGGGQPAPMQPMQPPAQPVGGIPPAIPMGGQPVQPVGGFTPGQIPGQVPGQMPMGQVGGVANPYQSPAHDAYAATTVQKGKIAPTSINIGSVINHAMEVWKNNFGLLAGVLLVVIGINIAISVGINVVDRVVSGPIEIDRNDPFGANARAGLSPVRLVGTLISWVIGTYLGLGQTRISLTLCRGQRAEFDMLFGGGSSFLSLLGLNFVLTIFYIGGLVMGLLLGPVGIAVFAIVFLVLLLLLWPCWYLVVDDRAGTFGSISTAPSFAGMNAGQTIVLFLMAMGIAIAGVLALCIGFIFAAGLISVMWATAYLNMTGQIQFGSRY